MKNENNYSKLLYKSIFKFKKIFTKLEVDLYGRVKSNFYHRVVNQLNNTPNNRYTPLTIISADCHKHFQLNLVFSEHIEQINIKYKVT